MMTAPNATAKLLRLWIVAGTLLLSVQCAVAQGIQAGARSVPNYGTMGFDNTRFFSARAGEDWVKISATGRRSFISDIDPGRTALVIVDLQRGICSRWGQALATVDHGHEQ